MGKKYKLLFVMSIISFVVSALCIVVAIDLVVSANKAYLSSEFGVLDILLMFYGLSMPIIFVIFAVITSIAAAINILLGILGIICCKQQGRCSLGCLIMGGILSLLTEVIIVQSIFDGSFEIWTFSIFAYFVLYTAGAAFAYGEKRK